VRASFASASLRLIISLIALAFFAPIKPFSRSGQCAVFQPSFYQPFQDLSSEIARLINQLKSSDEEERRDATLKLASLDTPAVIPALTSVLNDPSERIRALAITGLAQMGDSSLVPTVAARLLQDKKPFVRKAAAYALGRFHSNEGTAALTAALKDKDKEVRGAAAVSLGEYQDAQAISPLERALEDKSEFVRAQSARALGANGRAAAGSVPLLIKLLTSDKDQEVKRQAATALGRIGDRAALPALEHAQHDRDPYLSQAALEAIKKITGVRSQEPGVRSQNAPNQA